MDRWLTRHEEARARQPREVDAKFLEETATGFKLPPTIDPLTLLRSQAYPVFGISWFDGLAFLAWLAKRDGIPWTLMHEEVWEESARGVDARIYSYGDEFEGSYSHTNISLSGELRPMPVGTFAVDESPYGIRDLSGGVQTWLLSAAEVPYREWCCLRGGAWSYASSYARAASRRALHPSRVLKYLGLRVAARPRN